MTEGCYWSAIYRIFVRLDGTELKIELRQQLAALVAKPMTHAADVTYGNS